MAKFIKTVIQGAFNKIGFKIIKYPDKDLYRRLKTIKYCGINKIFDIGANAGQYGIDMRNLGYNKKIVSFEPLKDAYKELEKVSKNDKNWITNNYALGHENIKSIINISKNSWSSSILEILPKHLENAPDSLYIGKDEIEIKKLNSIFNSFYEEGDNLMAKIDTQGYEKNVIDGANEVIHKFRIVHVEMSIVPLYDNEVLFFDMVKLLEKKGFQLFSLENGLADQITGRLLQVDGIFVNETFLNMN
jgi:FkbM family methyltransferase